MTRAGIYKQFVKGKTARRSMAFTLQSIFYNPYPRQRLPLADTRPHRPKRLLNIPIKARPSPAPLPRSRTDKVREHHRNLAAFSGVP